MTGRISKPSRVRVKNEFQGFGSLELMEIELRLFGAFRDYLPEGRAGFAVKLSFQGEKTAAEIMADLGFPSDAPRIILVKGSHVDESYLARDGDVISVFPPLGGG